MLDSEKNHKKYKVMYITVAADQDVTLPLVWNTAPL